MPATRLMRAILRHIWRERANRGARSREGIERMPVAPDTIGPVGALEMPLLRESAQGGFELGKLNRLTQEVVGTRLDGAHGEIHGSVAREQNDARVRRNLAKARQERERVTIREREIQQHEVGNRSPSRSQSALAGIGLRDFEARH